MRIIIIENSGVCWQGTIFGDGIGLLSREYIWLHGASFKYNDSNSSMDDKTYFILAYAWKELIALLNIDSCKCNDSKSCTQSPTSMTKHILCLHMDGRVNCTIITLEYNDSNSYIQTST